MKPDAHLGSKTGCKKFGMEITTDSKRRYDIDLIKQLYHSGKTEKEIVEKTVIKVQTFRSYRYRGKFGKTPTPKTDAMLFT